MEDKRKEKREEKIAEYYLEDDPSDVYQDLESHTEEHQADDTEKAEEPAPKESSNEKKGRKKTRGAWKFVAAFAAGFAACLAVFAVVIFALHLGRVIPEADYDFYNDISDKFGKYYVIMQMIDEDPLVKKTPEVITDEHIKNIVDGLEDPYAAYYTPEEYAAFKSTFEGNYVGIGILVGETEEGLKVEQVYDDGPAFKAGMKAGDIIVRVDDVEPEGIDDAVSRMKGEEGTKVKVTVVRDGKEIDLKMERKAIGLDSVGYAVSEDDPKVGYIRVTLFAEDTDDEFKNAVKELQDKGCNKFILDLRQNGGGLTDVSIEMADYLLPACKIMTEIKKDGSAKVYNSKKSSADLDLVVLVDENTASASEILTAAIQENQAGTVIGTKTYGKGVTQVSRQFKDGSAIKMTVTEYLTPKGHHVQGNGITPDIEATDDDILDKALEELAK